MADYQAAIAMNKSQGHASKSQAIKKILPTSCCGNPQTMKSPAGTVHGASAAPAGILNARQWRQNISACPLIFMAAAQI